MLKKRKIKLPTIILVLLIALLLGTQVVRAYPLTYGLSLGSTTGGSCYCEAIEVTGESRYKLHATASYGYEFSHWDLSDNTTIIWGTGNDKDIEVILSQNARAVANFKSNNTNGGTYKQQKKEPAQVNAAINTVSSDNIREQASNSNTAKMIAAICLAVAIFLLLSFLYRYLRGYVRTKKFIRRKRL